MTRHRSAVVESHQRWCFSLICSESEPIIEIKFDLYGNSVSKFLVYNKYLVQNPRLGALQAIAIMNKLLRSIELKSKSSFIADMFR